MKLGRKLVNWSVNLNLLIVTSDLLYEINWWDSHRTKHACVG